MASSRRRTTSWLEAAPRTTHDADLAALDAIMAEWTSGDEYATRVANIRAGLGLTGGAKLTSGTTVLNDNTGDSLTGGLGDDWYFVFSPDSTTQAAVSKLADQEVAGSPSHHKCGARWGGGTIACGCRNRGCHFGAEIADVAKIGVD